ncbi:MAG: nucleoside triphosphate pyrophosphohydrolase [Steroidobacteraceae bacterium]
MSVQRLLDIMARLRDPQGGCPWDLEQDFASIAPYTIEEAYEVADAIERADVEGLREELGDLLFQVAFHAQLARERGWFDFAQVAEGICDKMVRRHPHVFGDVEVGSSAEQTEAWERLKAAEKKARGGAAGALDDVPVGLPAMTRARKLGSRAAREGFDWPDRVGPRQKIAEELAELDQELEVGADRTVLESELGDVLFAIVNLARHLDIDPEAALRRTNQKFSERFAHVESRLRERGLSGREAGLDQLEVWWQEAKRRERGD